MPSPLSLQRLLASVPSCSLAGAADVVADDDRNLAPADPAIHRLVEVGSREFAQQARRNLPAAPCSLVAAGRRAGAWSTGVGVVDRHVPSREIAGRDGRG